MQIAKWVFIFLFGLIVQTAFAQVKPLSQDQAFKLSVQLTDANKALVHFKLAPGYYLYQSRLHFSADEKTTLQFVLPQGVLKYDTDGKRYEAYADHVLIPILVQTTQPTITLKVEYQGCSSFGFCYPPMKQAVHLNLANSSVEHETISPFQAAKERLEAATRLANQDVKSTPAITSLLQDQTGVRDLFSTHSFAFNLLLFLALGVLLAFTPCVWPMIPILTGMIVGQQETLTTKRAFFLSLAYVLGSALTYAGVGIFAAFMGSSLQVWLQQAWAIAIVSILFLILALSMFGLYDLQLPQRFQNHLTSLSNKQSGGRYLSVFLMGMISSLILSPCVSAPLIGILMYISQSGSLWLGASALFVLAIGMGLPLLLIGVSAGRYLPKSGPWMVAVKNIFGFLMVGMAIWLASRVLPINLTMFAYGLLLIAIALYFVIQLPRLTNWRLASQTLGFMLALSGVAILSGFTQVPFLTTAHESAHHLPKFIIVKNAEELNERLSLAKAAKKPVILDFYADWCESCIAMDKKVFNASDVKHALNDYVLLRADLSANTHADEKLLKMFDVIAPPTVLVFDNAGHEVSHKRIIGEVNAKEFLARVCSRQEHSGTSP